MTESVPGNRGLALSPADDAERALRQQWERIWREIAAVYSQGLPEPEEVLILARDSLGRPYAFGIT